MSATCAHCGTPNSVLRVFGWYSGLHARCRGCGEVFRLVDSIGGLLLVHLAFGGAYLLGMAALLDVEPPPWWNAMCGGEALGLGLWIGGLPALPGLAAFLLAISLLTPTRRWVEQDPSTHDPERHPQPMTRTAFTLGALFAAIGTIVITLTVAFGLLMQHFGEVMVEHAPPAEPQPVALSEEARHDWVFVDRDGTPRVLDQLRGEPVVLHYFDDLDFGCRAQLASLSRLRRKVRDAGVHFVVCALVDEPRFAELLAESPVQIPLVRARSAPPDVLAPEVIPSTLFLDAENRLLWREAGIARWDTDAVERFLKELAGG